MARHRNVRTMKYEEEFFDEDDVEDCYGQSFDDKYCISPGTAAQFTFSRGSNFDLGSYISGESSPAIPSQVPEIITPKSQSAKVIQKFSDLDEARLNSCLDQVREIIADLPPHEVLVETIKKHNFNSEAVLNELLSSPDAPKPQRQPRQGRRVQEFSSDLSGTSSYRYIIDDDDDNNDDHRRDILKCTLVMTVPQYKFRQKYDSVGEEEASSYSSYNSGDTEDQGAFLSEQNINSPCSNKIHCLESGRLSNENVVSSDDDNDLEVDGRLQSVDDDNDLKVDGRLQSVDDDNDLEVDGRLQSVDDDNDLEVDGGFESVDDNCLIIEQTSCIVDNTESCDRFESFNLSTNNPDRLLIKNSCCNDKGLNSVKTIPVNNKFPALKSDKNDLLKLFAMANINKQKMEEESAGLSLANNDLSAFPKASLCEKISRNPLQNQSNLKANYSKCLPFTNKNSGKSSLADIFQQRHSNNNNNDDGVDSHLIEKCEKCSANQHNSKKNSSNKISLVDLTRQQFGSNSKEPVPKVGDSLSQMISSFCPNKENNLSDLTNSTKLLVDQTNHCFEKCANLCDSKKFSFQSLKSENELLHKNQNKKRITANDETSLSLVDLRKQESDYFQNPKNVSLEVYKLGLEDTSQVTGIKTTGVEQRGKKVIEANAKESKHFFSKSFLDNEKKDCPREFSPNNEFTISNNSLKKDCQPMSLGELFSQVNNRKIDFNCDTTSKLEDLWQGPSNKHRTEQQQQQQSENLPRTPETPTEKFILPSFLNEVSSEYQNIKTIHEAPASLFGRVISYNLQMIKCTKTIPKRKINRYHRFSYKTQTSNINFNQEAKLVQIVPFDFSKPSPDDIVKKQQSRAFSHKNTMPSK